MTSVKRIILSVSFVFCWIAGAVHAQFNSVSAFPNPVFVNSPMSVKFVADIQPNPKLLRTSVRLLRESGGVFNVAGTMRDDGQGGDDVANDNRFTLALNVQSSEIGAVNFRASAAYSGTVQRVQSSVVSVGVTAPVDLEITSGQQEITLLEGESSATAFTVQVSNQDGGSAFISTIQTIEPNTGLGVVTDLPPGGFSTTAQNQTFVIQNSFTGVAAGEYLVTLAGTLNASGTTDQATSVIKVHVLPASGIGQLSLATYPGGIKSNTSSPITFGAKYSIGTASPTSVQLFEVTQAGATVQIIGEMKDDGVLPDISDNDQLFSLEPIIAAGPSETVRYFRAVANFPGGDTSVSPIVALASFPFDIGFAPIDVGSIVKDPSTGTTFTCNQLIVVFKPNTSLVTIQQVLNGIGGTILGVEPIISAYQVGITCRDASSMESTIRSLILHPSVRSANVNTLDQVFEFSPNDAKYSEQFAPSNIHADEAWLIARGKGVTVAVLDTGVDYNHEELIGRVTKGHDYINDDDDPQDDNSHGTHVAGIIAAKGNNSTGVAGTAWDANILAIKVCGGRAGVPGVGSVTDCPVTAQVSGIFEAVPKAKIINMSLGGGSGSIGDAIMNLLGEQTAVAIAIEHAVQSGTMVVAAAGNDSSSKKRYPCAYPGVLCVGSATKAGTRSCFSNYGQHVDIAAPGGGGTCVKNKSEEVCPSQTQESILSTVPGFCHSSGYYSMRGTSMAAPYVSGVAALVWSHNPKLTRGQVEDRLLKTAAPLPGLQIGPLVDAFDAVFNGSFEHELSGWKVVGTGSAINKLGSITPTKDKRMGMASTGPDAIVTSSEIYQSFTIQPDVTKLALSFNYAMITEEYPEFVGSSFDDHLIVTLETPDGKKYQLAIESVNASSFSSISGIDFPGGDNTVGWTGWKNVNSVKIPVTPGGGIYRMRVEDRGDGVYDTNGLLDNIRFK